MNHLLYNTPETFSQTLVLAHGAGAGMDTPFMTTIAEGVAEAGIQVVRFEFPYMIKRRVEGKKSPPNRLPILQAAFLEVLENIQGDVVIGGKSMGGRVATTILSDSSALGAIALGYPFHPPGKPEKLRIEHFQAMSRPLLVLQGERDPFGKLMENPSQWLPAHASLTWIPDGEHSFKPRKQSGLTLADNLNTAVTEIVQFMKGLETQ